MSNKQEAQLNQALEGGLSALFKGIGAVFKGAYYGMRQLRKPVPITVFGATLLAAAGVIAFRGQIWSASTFQGVALSPIPKVLIIVIGGVLPLLYLCLLNQLAMGRINEALEGIGFTGKDGRGPKLAYTRQEKHLSVLGYESSIPLEKWKTSRAELETALNCTIRSMAQGKDKRTVELWTISSELTIPDKIQWDDKYIPKEEGKICVGVDQAQQLLVDVNSTPHMIVAGETGSGKSVLLRSLLWQFVNQCSRIFMIDFKGGVEFGKRYEQFGEVITQRDRALRLLQMLVAENTARLALFRELEVKKLSESNGKTGANLCRVVVFIDEIAEMLDKTGAQDKAIIEELEGCVSTIARLGRAAGINLIIGVQRPDAKILTGQIKNNVPVRICGRFGDGPASEIVLGNRMAQALPNKKGRFIFSVGNEITEMQGFLFDDDIHLRDINVSCGQLLVDESALMSEVLAAQPAPRPAGGAKKSRSEVKAATDFSDYEDPEFNFEGGTNH